MKIINYNEPLFELEYKLNEYTTQFGSIILKNTKGGEINNCYYFRFNKEKNDHEASIIDLYINKDNKTLQHVDFVSLRLFNIIEEVNLNFEVTKPFLAPTFDTSSWVSNFGRIRAFDYDNTKYLYSQYEVDLEIIHNSNKSVVQFLFGDQKKIISMSDQILFSIDENNNLSSLIILDEIEVPKLLSLF